MNDFTGVKVALLLNDEVVIIQRDNKPGLPYAGLWDLPGGGRENTETPFECARREIREELGITIEEKNVIWLKDYPSLIEPGQTAYFMVITVTNHDIDLIIFGDEGHGWKLIGIDEFIDSSTNVGPLRDRLRDYLSNTPRVAA